MIKYFAILPSLSLDFPIDYACFYVFWEWFLTDYMFHTNSLGLDVGFVWLNSGEVLRMMEEKGVLFEDVDSIPLDHVWVVIWPLPMHNEDCQTLPEGFCLFSLMCHFNLIGFEG